MIDACIKVDNGAGKPLHFSGYTRSIIPIDCRACDLVEQAGKTEILLASGSFRLNGSYQRNRWKEDRCPFSRDFSIEDIAERMRQDACSPARSSQDKTYQARDHRRV